MTLEPQYIEKEGKLNTYAQASAETKQQHSFKQYLLSTYERHTTLSI